MKTSKLFEQVALMDSPQIVFRVNLGPKKAVAFSHVMSTLTHEETVGQKTAAKTCMDSP